MIFQKIKTYTLRTLLAVAALFVTLLLCELLAFILISLGFSLPTGNDAPDIRTKSPKKYSMEIPAPAPEKVYRPKIVPEKDHFADFPDPHIDHSHVDVYTSRPHFEGQITKTHSKLDHAIYSIHLKMDERGRRDTNKQTIPYTRNFTLMGCSFAFGEAVDETETLSAYWQQKLPQYKTYNMSLSGHGPHSIIARTISHGFMDNITPEKGLAIYLYTDNQIKRSQGAMSVVGNWSPTNAIVEEVSDYQFIHRGSYYTERYYYAAALHVLWRSHFIQFFKIDWPFFPMDRDYDKIARELKGLEFLYKQKTSQDNPFIVAIYPEDMISTNKDKLKDALEKHRVLFIDYADYPIDLRLPETSGVPYDGHPNAKAYSHLADLLIRDLKDYLK